MEKGFKVTTVTPAYNCADHIRSHIQSLRALHSEFPVEIIVVDNGSEDETLARANEFSDVRVLREPIPSSYAARNRGIAGASGSVIAFIDSDCVADADWLASGVRAMEELGADMIAGRIEFVFDDRSSPWEIYDSLFNMDNETSVAKGCAKTANLFVRKELFQELGMFDPTATSGEDVAWTTRAVHSGKRLAYCDDSIVYHPTRNKGALIRKALRTGGGALTVAKAKSKRFYRVLTLLFVLKSILPPNPLRILRKYKAKGFSAAGTFVRVWGVAYVLGFVRACGVLQSLFGSQVRA